MLLLSLEVQNFRVLRQVHLTFGKGLNVLYGPNDLGKSSIAEALRVAFLLPVTSGACHKLVPWGTNYVPRVIVKFEMNDVVWQITKAFGAGPQILERVGESGTLFEEARGRDVEGRLREIIAWGIPAPGGRGAPRGLPESYLATALLGRQDEVSAILEASPEKDGDKSGLELVKKALGSLGQDPLVGLLLQRLQERTEKVFTEEGRLRRAEDSPLVQLSNKVKDQKERLVKLEEPLRQSGEIEKKVQALIEQRILAAEVYAHQERQVELLRKVRKAEEELERVRHHEQSTEEARCALAEIEEDLSEVELKHQQATSALLNVEKELQTARERLARAVGSQEMVRENVRQTRDANRSKLVAKREGMARQIQSAREVIQAREQVQIRESELNQADAEHQRAQQTEVRAQDLAELASLLAEQQQAHAFVEALRIAKTERDDRATAMTEAAAELKKAETALEDAELDVKSQKDAFATAQRERAESHFRKETLRASLIRAESADREALQTVARAKAAMVCNERLGQVKKLLAELEVDERDLETKLSTNAAEKQVHEARLPASTPLPIQPALLVGLLGGAIAAALGIALQISVGVLAVSIVGTSLLGTGMTAFVLRHRRLRQTIQLLYREIDDLAKVRENLLEKRNQVSVNRGVAQVRVDSARVERDQAVAAVGDVSLEKAESRLQEARRELESIQGEVTSLESNEEKHATCISADVEAAEQMVMRLKEQVLEKRRMLDDARDRRSETQMRLEAATSSAALVDLAGVEQRVTVARMKAGREVAPDPKEAQNVLQIAKQKSVDLETAMKIARERLLDARSSFKGMADALGQPADQVLAEAEKNREDVDKALASLEGVSSTEVASAEKEFLEAQAQVTHLDKELKETRLLADAASQARDQVRKNRDEETGKLQEYLRSSSNMDLSATEAGLRQVRKEMENLPRGSFSSSEDFSTAEALLEKALADFQRTEKELHKTRGQLELVGGTVLRDQRDQEFEVLESLRKCAEDLELEYRATKRLLDVLKEEEMKIAAHLGRSLAKPVTEIFSEFTSGRYAQIVLDSGLRFRSVMAKGDERELASLSVGTRDQLATFVRLALAAHLKSVIVLDDQLAQSDPRRLDWFRERLRASVRDHEHQIVVITCRPLDYLHPEEIPAPPSDKLVSVDGKLAVVDLERLTSCW